MPGLKCKQCGGVGHGSNECPSEKGLCHNCGSKDHPKRHCPHCNKKPWLQMKQAMMKALNSLDQDYDSHISEPENDIPESDTDCSSQEEEEDEPENIIKSQIARMRVNMMSNKVEERRLCDCEYGNSCIKLVLDSGCTRHITKLKVQQPTPCDSLTRYLLQILVSHNLGSRTTKRITSRYTATA